MWKTLKISLTSRSINGLARIFNARLLNRNLASITVTNTIPVSEPNETVASNDILEVEGQSLSFNSHLNDVTFRLTTSPANREDPESAYNISYFFYNMSSRVREGKMGKDEILNNQFFQQQCQRIQTCLSTRQEKNSLTGSAKLIILKSLQLIGMPSDAPLVQSLLTDVIWQVKVMPISVALDLLAYQIRFQQSEQQRLLISTLRNHVITHLDKITQIESLVDFYKLTHFFDKETVLRLDELAQSFILKNSEMHRPKAICYLLSTIAGSGRRPKPLIKLLTFAMRNSDLKQIKSEYLCNLISALSSLNVPDLNILSSACTQLVKKDFTKDVDSKTIEWLLKSVVRLNFKPLDLLMHLDQLMRSEPHVLGKKFTVEYLIACAKLNHKPANVGELLGEEQESGLDEILPKRKEVAYLEMCWALAFHGILDESKSKRLFEKQFVDQLFKDKLEVSYLKRKLLQVKAHCALELNLEEVHLPECVYDFDKAVKDKQLVSLIGNDLENVVHSKYTLKQLLCELGYHYGKNIFIRSCLSINRLINLFQFLDFVFAVNDSLTPMEIGNFKSFNELCQSLKPEYKA